MQNAIRASHNFFSIEKLENKCVQSPQTIGLSQVGDSWMTRISTCQIQFDSEPGRILKPWYRQDKSFEIGEILGNSGTIGGGNKNYDGSETNVERQCKFPIEVGWRKITKAKT